MQALTKAQLAAALVATFGFAMHGAAFAGTTDSTTMGASEKQAPSAIAQASTDDKAVAGAKSTKSSAKSTKTSSKSTKTSSKGKTSSCKGMGGSCKGKKAAKDANEGSATDKGADKTAK